MKDVREKYTDVTEDDFDPDVEIRRQGRHMKNNENLDELAVSLYDFLYGNDSELDIF